jgi:MFS family permease
MSPPDSAGAGVAAGAHAQPVSPYAWYVVAMLMLLYINSFLDRVIISLVVEPLKADLGISDTGVSLLQGLAFALFYSTLGVPFGRLADRHSRRNIMSLGAGFWAMMATACGLAQSYFQLFVARMGLGVGEATLMPAAYSMVSDYFPRHRLARAYAVLMLGAPLGTALAFFIGGWVVSFAGELGSVTLPVLGEVRSWQLVFLITGLPGLPLALWVWLTVREPRRTGLLAGASRHDALPLAETLRWLGARKGMYLPLLLGLSLTAMFGSGYMSWVAVFFMRVHGLSAGEVGQFFGAAALVGGVSGLLLGSLWCDLLARHGRRDAAMRTAVHALCVALPLGVAAPLVGDVRLAFLLIAGLVFFLTFPQGSNVAAFTLVTPNQLRGQVAAVFLLAINVAGLGFGATLVALFTDYVFGDPARIHHSLALASVVTGVPALLALSLGLRPYRRAMEEAERLQVP